MIIEASNIIEGVPRIRQWNYYLTRQLRNGTPEETEEAIAYLLAIDEFPTNLNAAFLAGKERLGTITLEESASLAGYREFPHNQEAAKLAARGILGTLNKKEEAHLTGYRKYPENNRLALKEASTIIHRLKAKASEEAFDKFPKHPHNEYIANLYEKEALETIDDTEKKVLANYREGKNPSLSDVLTDGATARLYVARTLIQKEEEKDEKIYLAYLHAKQKDSSISYKEATALTLNQYGCSHLSPALTDTEKATLYAENL